MGLLWRLQIFLDWRFNMQKSLIILDRDGVINEDSPDYIKSPEEWIPIPGSLEAIAQLTQSGFTVVVATNQSGIARGYYDEETLRLIHLKMQGLLKNLGSKIDHAFYCPHAPEDACECRKPKPGLLYQVAEWYGQDLNQVPYVGDSLRDIQAGLSAGCKPILVKTGNGTKTLNKNPEIFKDISVFEDLMAFAKDIILQPNTLQK